MTTNNLNKDKQQNNKTEQVYNDWINNPSLSITCISAKNGISSQRLRAFVKKYKKPRPDKERVEERRKQRQGWIAKAYERGLRKDLTANEVANWARSKCEFCIERVDIHSYANKFNLPLLKEKFSRELKRNTKYG